MFPHQSPVQSPIPTGIQYHNVDHTTGKSHLFLILFLSAAKFGRIRDQAAAFWIMAMSFPGKSALAIGALIVGGIFSGVRCAS